MKSNGFRSRVVGRNGNGQAAARPNAATIINDGDEVTIQEFKYAPDGEHRKKDAPFRLIADSKSPNRLASMLPGKKLGESFFSRSPALGESSANVPFYRPERVEQPNSPIQITTTSLALNQRT